MTGDSFEIDLSQFMDLFLDESRRHIRTINTGILLLEQNPEDAQALEEVFRAAHTLKGMAATMGLESIALLSHATEDLLHHVRSREWFLTPAIVDLVFRAIDAIEGLVGDVATEGSADTDVSELVAELTGFRPAGIAPAVVGLTGEPIQLEATHSPQFEDFSEVEEAPESAADVVLDSLVTSPDAAPSLRDESERGTVSPDSAAQGVTPRPTRRTVNLDVRHLDRLLDIVQEMVINLGRVEQLQEQHGLVGIEEAVEEYALLLDQLQAAVLQTRMVPVSYVFGRFPRMVRDLLRAEGKQARLIVEGADVELDRMALDAISDSVVHLLRNAVDHGLETPEERESAGKSPVGLITLSARRDRDSIVIEVTDDGRGLDLQRIAGAAVSHGLASAEEIAEMSEAQVLDFICTPGFSLSSEVTTVSGRGVGMDAVKNQVESLRGTVGIETRPGQGSAFRLQLPVALALLDAFLVDAGGELYAVPSSQIERIIDVTPDMVEHVGSHRLLRLPDEVLPLHHMGELLGGSMGSECPQFGLAVRRFDRLFCVWVEDIVDHTDVVVKPLPRALDAIPGLTGVTILGDGQVVFIVDAAGLQAARGQAGQHLNR